MLEINYPSVLIATILSMVLGFLYYSPLILGEPWMKLRGYTKKSLKKAQKEMGPLFGLSLVMNFVMAFMLAHVIQMSQITFEYPALSSGFTSGLFMWLGFVLPVQVTNEIYGDKNWPLLLIDTGYQLSSLLVMGVTIGFMAQ